MRQPVSLMKYENEETIDPHTGYIVFKTSVWYEGAYDRWLYEYSKDQNQITGSYKLHMLGHIDESPHQHEHKGGGSQ